ncbi:MAG TPA: hypothetical protein VF897_14765, partial [Roseiflexaceae bacterium]
MDDRSDIGEALQSLGEGARMDRRTFMRGFALLGALAGTALAGCAQEPALPAPARSALPTPTPRLRAAFSHNGLKTIWNQR